MNASTRPFYAALAEQLNRGATRAALGLLGFRSDPLREHLRELFQAMPGTGHSFLADPVFEATFGWEPASKTLGQLSGKLLHADLVQALEHPATEDGKPLVDPWEAGRPPYRHQWEAWRALIEQTPPRSVLVSSGTGSGKTECFLIPILNDLVREAENHPGPLTGVRALFLYPLNALIKSQRDRLTAWMEPFEGRLRYCLYKGDTPPHSPRRRSREWRNEEVQGRDELRGNPPPILVTNATMLEYMLVRDDDRPILEQSQGRLRWIVIDEAHSYIGSQAAELTLLLRRVLHGFGCRAEDIHFVATSATIAGDGEETKTALRTFLADIAGVEPERVTVVMGRREVPELSKALSRLRKPHPGLEPLRSLSPQERYAVLAADPHIRQIRQHLIEKATLLSSLAREAYGNDSEDAQRKTLELLDLCSQAWIEKDKDQKEALLPLRGHFFQRAQNGLWACANGACTGRTGTLLDHPAWAFGKVFLERRQNCDACGSPVFELVQCAECGAEHLSAVEIMERGVEKLKPRLHAQDEDEFQQELEPLDSEESEGEETEVEEPAESSRGTPCLLVGGGPAHPTKMELLPDHRLQNWDGKDGIAVYLQVPDGENALGCPCCKERERPGRRLFQPVRLGAPFLLQTATPILLRHMKPFGKSQEALPWEGRRLISFTDSRQGTARFAAKIQQEAERNYVRSLIYHKVADRARPVGSQPLEELRQEIAKLEQAIATNPSLSDLIGKTLAEKRNKLEELSAVPLGRLAWSEAMNELLATQGFNDWLLPPLQDQTFGLGDRQLAELCLWREFLFRPKRQFSMEGLGLLRLGYPALNNVTKVPPICAQHGVKIEEWRELVQVALDFQLRGSKAVNIPRDIMRWIGYPGSPTVIIPPGQQKIGKQRTWPTTRTATTRRARLVRMLAYAFRLDLNREKDCADIEEMLRALWTAVQPLLSATESAYTLDLGRQAEIVEVREAWLCPVTRRLLPVTFRGITPYLPETPTDALARCKKFPLPKLERPFWNGAEPDECERWLETNPAIRNLRKLGVWSDLSDRIAGFSPYFRAVEHSAQLRGELLTRRETEFKSGKLNLMSCSTTMEMGVDIGGLTAVAMNNAPPHPANFLQRAGRAGRRGETAAVSFTLCKSTPHGEAVFKNPLWPFITALPMPRVSLQSERIVQRHVNAMSLAAFLAQGAPDDVRRLSVGWFFEAMDENNSAPWEKFRTWLQDEAVDDDRLQQGIRRLLQRTCLEGRRANQVLATTATMIEQVHENWHSELAALLENLRSVGNQQAFSGYAELLAFAKHRQGNKKAECAIKYQLERFLEEYLLSELANRGFLPGYGFPTGVVSLLTTTLDDFNRRQASSREEREDNRALRAGFPSRDLPLAIRDYAPGTDTVLDGRVYRCGGVTLNWHVPAEQEAGPEIQSLRWVWRCQSCGGNGTRPTWPEHCPHCGENNTSKLTRYEYLQPAGFAVDIRYKPHNDITIPQYIPVRDPLISLEGAAWLDLPTAALGRCRVSSRGSLFHRTDGLHGEGYALCLRCGFADSMLPDAVVPETLRGHKRLRGGRNDDREQECPGNRSDIREGLHLGLVTHTDVFELQLQDLSGRPDGRIAAYSLSVALRRALTQQLGIEEREIGCTIQSSRDVAGYPVPSIYLYDTASDGAGYSTQAVHELKTLFESAREVLKCRPRDCDAACQACLLTYDTQHHLDDLDRKAALAVLDERFLQTLELPAELQVFGPHSHTRLEMEPLGLALRRELQHQPAIEIRVYLGGAAKLWEPLAWRLREELMRLGETGLAIRLILPQTSLNDLNPAQRDELAALIAVIGAEVYLPKTSPMIGTAHRLPLVLEIGKEGESVRWACGQADALAPASDWGAGAQFVFGRSGPLPAIPGDWLISTPAQLRPADSKLAELRIGRELNVTLREFGPRAWQLILDQTPRLKERLQSGGTLAEASYSDRYLRSPLVLLLLREWLGALAEYPGVLGSNTRLAIATSRLERYDLNDPRWLHHDWRDSSDRKQVFEDLLNPLGRFTLTEKANSDLPHARELKLEWTDGAVWTIRLDQGLGYWRTASYTAFPFDQAVERQIDTLRKASVRLEAGHHAYPTHWYIVSDRGK